ncbi:unnamed protein product [Ostreobium quekettii]|uniref:Uncharacterized protein n=1 Tax=Ostreobium quekettii TaxID=121088 RepID=A0A8S1JIV0_9CHLO|nr:unnamed protein product [Ostreobium quekettii]
MPRFDDSSHLMRLAPKHTKRACGHAKPRVFGKDLRVRLTLPAEILSANAMPWDNNGCRDGARLPSCAWFCGLVLLFVGGKHLELLVVSQVLWKSQIGRSLDPIFAKGLLRMCIRQAPC